MRSSTLCCLARLVPASHSPLSHFPSAADWFRAGSDWGYQQGCSFATNTCILNGDGQGTPKHYSVVEHSTVSNSAVCTTDRLAVGFSNVSVYSSSLASQYRYFNNPAVGGAVPVTFDYCPAIQGYNNLNCMKSTVNDPQKFLFGAAYGPDSACVESTLIYPGYSASVGRGAGCYSIYCPDANTAQIKVTAGASQTCGTTVTCTAANAGTSVSVPGYLGSIICPDPVSLCGSVRKYAG